MTPTLELPAQTAKYRLAVYAVFAVSGAVSLLYQVLWARWLTRIFGFTTVSVSVVLTVFMAGLAFGSWIAGRRASSIRRPLVAYAWLEVGIGAFALLFPWLTEATEWIYVQLVSTESPMAWSLGLRLLLSFLLLVPPTTLMGATLPFLTELFRQPGVEGRSWKVGLLYAANTLGAAVGALGTGFLLIELLGERSTTLVAAAANMLAAWMALKLSRPVAGGAAVADESLALDGWGRFACYILAASGGVALASEVLWTRLLETAIGNSTYDFSLILVVYLVGIAGGAWLMSLVVHRVRRLASFLLASQIGVAVWTLIALEVFGRAADLVATSASPTWHDFLVKYAVAGIVLLPLALCSGAGFPLATRILEPEAVEAHGQGAARAYSYNTVGAMVGAFVGGFFIAPLLDFFEALFAIAAFGGLVTLAGALWMSLGERAALGAAPRLRNKRPVDLWVLAAAGALVVVLGVQGTLGESRFVQRLESQRGQYEVVFHRPGLQGITTALVDPSHERAKMLLVNGHGMTVLDSVTKMMAHVPMLLHPNPKRTLILCFGMGTTYRSAVAHGGEVTVVELADEVYQAFPFFFEDVDRIRNYEKGRMVTNDGRNFLRLTREKYDVITIDPPPPIDSAGVNNLYSQELAELVLGALAEDGIAAHWVPFPGTNSGVADWKTFGMLVQTFAEVFPHSYMLDARSFGGVHVLGSLHPIEAEPSELARRILDPAVLEDLNEWDPLGVDYFRTMRPTPFVSPSVLPRITDDRPRLEFHLIRLWGGRRSAAGADSF